MPAYIVTENDENTGGVIFAKDKRTAMRIGASEYGDGDVDYVTATRAKSLDCYEGTGVPARVLIADGWHFECHGCGMRIDDTSLYDMRLPVSGVVGIENSAVYCCHTCRMEHLAREAAIKAYGIAFLDMLRDVVRARFGDGVEFVANGRRSDHFYIQRNAVPLVVEEAHVGFNFPGMEIGPAQLDYRHEGLNGRNLVGPVKPYFTCCYGDREAFEAWAGTKQTAPCKSEADADRA